MAAASSFVGGLVGAVKLRLLVDNATSTNDDPTPIYVLDEVVQALAAGDTRAGVDAVVARLGHRSPVVKQKALKLVAHIGRKGSPDLRRLMSRQSAAVKALLHFRCDPDPFKGDTVWKRVQEYAQEALNAIHGTPDAPAQPAGHGALGGRIRGFGSEAGSGGGYGGGSGMMGFGSESASAGGGGGGGSSGRMVGFGSADVVQSGMQAISSGMRNLGDGLAKQRGLLRQDGYSSSQLDDGAAYSSGAGNNGSSGGRPAFAGPIVQSGAPAAAPAAAAAAAAGAGGQHAAAQRLVERICTPAGLRAAPSREDTAAFVDSITALDGPTVAQLLQRKLEAGPWQATLRALCAIEAVVESGSSAACGQVAVHFQAHPEAVRWAADSPQASVRQRSQKVLALLGDPTAAAAAGSGAAPGQQQQQQLFTEDLLGERAGPAAGAGSSSSAAGVAGGLADLLGEPEAPPAAADLLAGLAVPPVSQQPAPAAADLFGGMLLGGQQATPAAAPGFAPSAAVQPAAPAMSDLDLLGGLSLGGGSMVAPAAMPAHAAEVAPSPQAGGLGDLLGGLSLGPGPATSSAFGGFGSSSSSSSRGGGFGLHSQQQQWQQTGYAAGGQYGLGASPLQQAHSGGAPPLMQFGASPVGHPPPLYSGLGNGGGMHRQPSLTDSAPLPVGSMLGTSGILGSDKDTSFKFVDDALAAARRKH